MIKAINRGSHKFTTQFRTSQDTFLISNLEFDQQTKKSLRQNYRASLKIAPIFPNL